MPMFLKILHLFKVFWSMGIWRPNVLAFGRLVSIRDMLEASLHFYCFKRPYRKLFVEWCDDDWIQEFYVLKITDIEIISI